jgi:hypothetical protein
MRANTDPVVVASAGSHLSVFTVGTNNQLYYTVMAGEEASSF